MDKKLTEWASVKSRFDGQVTPSIEPSFELSKSSTVITIGSCFARNIEEHLSLLGVHLPSFDFMAPYKESSNRPNGVLNKFTPSAIREELAWAESVINGTISFEESIKPFAMNVKGGNVVDLQMNYAPISPERFSERRKDLLQIYQHIPTASCVTITLGLVERWCDKETGLSVFGAPSTRDLMRQKDRFEFKPMNFSESFSEVEEIIAIVRRLNSNIKLLITTSPVPLNKTFVDKDVVVANSYSKSTLRSVCGEISDKYDFVDYFPSYEMVNYRDPAAAFGDDLRHVNDHVVGDVVQLLVENYFTDTSDFERSLRSALGDLTAKKVNTPAMLNVLENASKYEINKQRSLLLSRVAWRCGKQGESRKYLEHYFSYSEVDPRDIKALNFIASRNEMISELKEYLQQILELDKDNERAIKFLQALSN